MPEKFFKIQLKSDFRKINISEIEFMILHFVNFNLKLALLYLICEILKKNLYQTRFVHPKLRIRFRFILYVVLLIVIINLDY